MPARSLVRYCGARGHDRDLARQSPCACGGRGRCHVRHEPNLEPARRMRPVTRGSQRTGATTPNQRRGSIMELVTTDSALGSTLHAWRDRLAPTDVGLSGAGRRRAHGLRREELAGLAGLSVDYLVRLAQGRSSNPSAQVVESLARSLQLTMAERDHLYRLAGLLPPSTGAVSSHIPPVCNDSSPDWETHRSPPSPPTGPCSLGPGCGRPSSATRCKSPPRSGTSSTPCSSTSPRPAAGTRSPIATTEAAHSNRVRPTCGRRELPP